MAPCTREFGDGASGQLVLGRRSHGPAVSRTPVVLGQALLAVSLLPANPRARWLGREGGKGLASHPALGEGAQPGPPCPALTAGAAGSVQSRHAARLRNSSRSATAAFLEARMGLARVSAADGPWSDLSAPSPSEQSLGSCLRSPVTANPGSGEPVGCCERDCWRGRTSPSARVGRFSRQHALIRSSLPRCLASESCSLSC